MILKYPLLFLYYEIKIDNLVNYLFLSGNRHRIIINNILIINHNIEQFILCINLIRRFKITNNLTYLYNRLNLSSLRI